jgi:uncharacterized Zn finger protein
MIPKYDLEKIKSGIDEKTWGRAVWLHESGRVTEFEETYNGYTASVLGTEPYDVAVSESYFNQGDCSCFVGRTGAVCKHMIALAICAVGRVKPRKDKN